MLAECTAGGTRQELLGLFNVGSLSELRSQMPQFFRNNYFDEKTGKLQIANSIWINKNAKVKKYLTDTLAGRYYASSYYAAFGTSSAAEQLREWLRDHTGGRLGDKLPAAEDRLTHSILINTLYYYDQWDSAFSKENNVTAPFYLENGSSVQAEYMTKEKVLPAFDGAGYQAVDLASATPSCGSFCRMRASPP